MSIWTKEEIKKMKELSKQLEPATVEKPTRVPGRGLFEKRISPRIIRRRAIA